MMFFYKRYFACYILSAFYFRAIKWIFRFHNFQVVSKVVCELRK